MSPASSYPRLHLRLAVGAFYAFWGLRFFVKAADLEHADSLAHLATFGLASAATLWWLVDSMQRGRQIAFLSLWVPFAFWLFILPVHYFSTRGTTRIGRFLLHLVALITVAVMAAVAGFATTGRLP